MKKQLSALSLGLLLTGFNLGYAQTNQIQPCNTYAAMEEHFATDPAAKANYEASQNQFFNELKDITLNRTANKTAAVELTVPVVFHILHQGGPENVSDAMCLAALDQVNRDFARMGSDTAGIFAPFKALYINSDIKFMLAKKDPQGNCISGIVRHVNPKTIWYQGTAGPSNAYWEYTWNPTRYLNIYIVSYIVPSGAVSGGGVAGYTYKPNTWGTGNAHDAIVFTYNTFNPASGLYQARALSHEIGHWLNLSHTFGNTNNPGVACGDDGITDTPVTKGNYNACPASSTNTNILCATNVTTYYQNVENIMDYSTCAKNFTQDQTAAMRFCLGSTVSGRSNLGLLSNLSSSFTDVNGVGLCAPVAEFMTTGGDSYTICVGGTLNFKDYSYNGTTSRQWTANNGGVVASPTSSITNITFNTIGTSNVTLTCTNAQGSNSIVKTVTVLDATAAIQGLFSESFESGLPAGWTAENQQGSGWQQTSAASYHALNSFYLDGALSAGGSVDLLTMPMINLSNNPSANFTFAYSYARKNSTHNDVFKLQMSNDCGGTWTDVVTKNASIMVSESSNVTSSTPYAPGSPAEWAVVDVTTYPNWQNFVTSQSVLIRFRFTEGDQGQGNNFFLDAINLSGVTGVNELGRRMSLNMYPNPTTGVSNLQFILSDAATAVEVNVVDVLGKQVLSVANANMAAGQHNLTINDGNTLTKGIYFVNVSVNGTKLSKKLIIE